LTIGNKVIKTDFHFHQCNSRDTHVANKQELLLDKNWIIVLTMKPTI